MLIRAEEDQDRDTVHAVNAAGFETPAEADLVDQLRTQAHPIISLVAEDDGIVVGHIMFSPVSLPEHPDLTIMGLAPMAVAPAHQRRGVGSALVRAGLTWCMEIEVDAVVVLGHPKYYPRFGFLPAAHFGIGCEYDVPDEIFMAMELRQGALRGTSGTVKYHSLFRSV